MKFLKSMCVCLLLAIVSISFFACDSSKLISYSCSGTVNIESTGLEGVTIKSNVKEYTKTGKDGSFSFSEKAQSITIYPEKSGYVFQPRSYTLNEGENNINFIATKEKALEGTLTLSKIIVSPTSIVSLSDNYIYLHNGKNALKASEISVLIGNQTYNLIDQPNFLYKNYKNEISVNQNLKINCGEQTTLGILINTYFTSGYHEAQTTYQNYTYLYINKPQTNANLEEGKITYSIYGINSPSKAFTFDVSFVFNFTEKQ